MQSTIPQFGVVDPHAEYVLRPGGYAVVFNAHGEIAVVSIPSGLMLPGGGQHDGESAENAAVREAEEECGLQITLTRLIGVADELLFAKAEQTHFRKRCTFFLADPIAQRGAGESDHALVWLRPSDAIARLLHESQRWAVTEACRRLGG